MAQLIELVRLGRIDLSRSVTHKVSLEEVNRRMKTLEEKIRNPIKESCDRTEFTTCCLIGLDLNE